MDSWPQEWPAPPSSRHGHSTSRPGNHKPRERTHWSTSTVYWCSASKLKIPPFFYGMNRTFLWVDVSFFNQSYSDGITTKKKPTGYWRYYQDVGRIAVMRAAMEPGVHTRSDELILQISCNTFLAFKWISMMTSGQHISHYTTAKLSVHVWNHDLIWWQNKIDTQKHFRKTTSSWTLSKTKIPITIIKAQMLSNPNPESRTRDNKLGASTHSRPAATKPGQSPHPQKGTSGPLLRILRLRPPHNGQPNTADS